MKLMLLALVPAALGAQSPGSLFTANGALANAARDLRANAPGDIVTIIVADSASAAASGGTNTSRSSSSNNQIPALLGAVGAANPLLNLLNMTDDRSLQGAGETSRDLTFTTTMSARVVAATLNGLLAIEGSKVVTVNSERQVVTLRGYIRPVDVTPANAVPSNLISDLSIEINGRGVVEDAIKRPFVLYRILQGLLPF
jgi:flagellar L-ring protein precursor FlgH